ncbi:MAG: translocation/assembly module TamB domain-containing protein [bacterium]
MQKTEVRKMGWKKYLRLSAMLLGYLFSFLLICLLVLGLLTQTTRFRQTIRDSLIRQADRRFNLNLTLGRIEGNLLTGFTVHQVTLQGPGEETIGLDRMEITCSPMALLHGRLSFPLIRLSGLAATILRTKEGLFRIPPLPIPPFPSSPGGEGRRNGPGLSLAVQNLCLESGSLTFRDYLHHPTPQEMSLQNLQAEISFTSKAHHESHSFRGKIRKLGFTLAPHGLIIDNIRGKISYQKHHLVINDLEIYTPETQFEIQGSILYEKEPFYDIKGLFPKISLPELGKALHNLPFPSPLFQISALHGEARMRGTLPDLTCSIHLSFEADQEESQVEMAGNLDLSDLNFPRYEMQAKLVRFPLALWLPEKHQPDLPRTLDLRARLGGKGIRPENLSARFDIDISSFLLFDQPIEAVTLIGQYEKKRLQMERATIRSLAGSGEIQGHLDLLVHYPYDLVLSFQQVDLEKIKTGTSLPSSRLAGEIRLQGILGRSFSDDFQAAGLVHLSQSRLKDSFIDDLLLQGYFEQGRVRLSQGKVLLKGSSFSINGTVSSERMNLFWNLEKFNLGQLGFEPSPSPLRGNLTGEGEITGTPDKPHLEGKLLGQDLIYGNYRIDQVEIKGQGEGLSFDTMEFTLDLKASSLTLHEQARLSTFQVGARKKGPQIRWSIQGLLDTSHQIQAQGTAEAGRPWPIAVRISQFSFPLDQTVWKNKKPVQFSFDPNCFHISSLEIESEQGLISIQGKVAWTGPQELKVVVTGLPLEAIEPWARLPFPLTGTARGEIDLTGSWRSPEIHGKIRIDKGTIAGFPFEQFSQSFTYVMRTLVTEAHLMKKGSGIFHLSGHLPMDLGFGPVKNRWSIPGLAVQTNFQEIDLGFLPKAWTFIAQAKGTASGKAEIKGSLAEPAIWGKVEFVDTSFRIKPLLQTFTIKSARIEGDNRRIIINEMNLEGASGVGRLSGEIELSKFLIRNIQAKIKMDAWKIFYRRHSYLTLDGMISVAGSPSRISLSGETLIPQGRIRLSDFQPGELGHREILLVKEKGDETTLAEKEPSFFTRYVSLALKVDIPRNLWVSDERTNFEMKGDLEITKDYDLNPIISGSIDAIRGFYEFHGKRFTIQKATIRFQGLPEINPLLDMKTVYRIRDVEVYILITGTKNKPIVSLQSEPPLPQNEIVSYLVFGRATADLNQRESASLQGEAFALLGRVVATQVLGVLGEKLPVDTIQIRASEEGTSSLEVGKYLTQDVFVSFGKEFGVEGSEQLRVEYYLYSNITLEAEIRSDERSGMDIIWKKDF